MKKLTLALAFLALPVFAGDGGKIPWTECKNLKDFEKLQADGANAGVGTFIFFTSAS